MPSQYSLDRRRFFQASLMTAALPVAAGIAHGDEQQQTPEIIDTNIHLCEWPFRQLKYARTEALVAKLRKHRITRAWAGSFQAVVQKRLDLVSRQLAEECRTYGAGMLVPFGSVNPAWADWEEDLRRCHEEYRMSGLRLYPAYHGYTLNDPQFVRLIASATKRGLVVQIVLRLEDERVHHPTMVVPPVDVAPLVETLKRIPEAKVQLINSAGPLLGNNVAALVKETRVSFDIAATEGNGGVGRLIEGTLNSYRGAIPAERLMFGSHAPYFPCESALMKLFESPLNLGQLEKIMSENARRLIG